MKKLYVGNLPYAVNDEKLKEVFESVGDVTSAKVICDYTTQRSKGFGFVEMDSDEDAIRAIAELDGKDLDGRNLKVSEARPKTDKR